MDKQWTTAIFVKSKNPQTPIYRHLWECSVVTRTGIETEIILNDCNELPFEQYDLCSLFSNLFDNAIDACKKVIDEKNRFIEIKSRSNGGYFVVRVTNSCEEIFDAKKTFPLTKKRKGHGYGLQIIKSIVNKYHGDLNIDSANGKFCVTVALKLEENE